MNERIEEAAVDRQIAADLLVALIASGRVKPGGATGQDGKAVEDTVKAYQDLLAGISSVKFDV